MYKDGVENNLVPAIDQGLVTNDPGANAERIFDLLDASETTRQDYKYRIGAFLDFINSAGLTRDSFLEFKRHLADRNDLGVSTKNKYLAAARIFLKELNRQGLLPADITQNVKGFNQNKRHKREGLSDGEVNNLVGAVRNLPPSPQNARLKAILALLMLQGLRQIEIVRLDVHDLDLVSKTAMVLGKGRDDKESVSLHPETVQAIKEYLRTNKIADGPLFFCQSNNHRNQRLTTRAIRKIVTGTLRGLGIEKSTHGFRHYFTTRLVKTYKGDLLQVAQYTRHKSLEMLQVYNDNIKREADLPRFYETFGDISLSG